MEKEKILEKVAHFVAMSGSISVIPTLQSELVVINRDLELNRTKLKVLNTSNIEGKYFDSVAHVLDTTCELGFQTDIVSSENLLSEEIARKEAVIKDEEILHNQIEQKRENLNNSHSYVASIKVRLQSLSEKEPNNKAISKYQSAIVKEEERQGILKKELESLSKKYKSVQDKLLKVTTNITELEEKLAKLNIDLAQLRKKLSSKKNYENNELKQKAVSDKKLLQEKIDSLEDRKEEILKDPVWIADEIESLIANKGTEEEIISKVNYLYEQIEKLPYMKLKGNQASPKAIGDELNRLLAEKEELEAKIATGDYETLNNEFEKKRITHLEKRIAVLTSELKEANNIINDIDNDLRFNFSARVKEASDYLNYTENKYEEYKLVVDDSEEGSTERRAELQMALDTKEEDVAFARSIYQNYLGEQQKDVKEASILTTERIPMIEHEMSLINAEILEINERIKNRKMRQKDIVALTKDKSALEDLNIRITHLNNRKQFVLTPASLLSELKDLITKKPEPTPILIIPSKEEKPGPIIKAVETPAVIDKATEPKPVELKPVEEKPINEKKPVIEETKISEKPTPPNKEEKKPELNPNPTPIILNEGFLPNIDSMES